MRRGAVMAVAFAVGLGAATLAGAVERSHATRGWISAVDPATKTFKLKGKSDVLAFKLEDSGKVMEKAKPAAFADLKTGEHVMVRYTMAGSDRLASEVDILAAHMPAATKPAPSKSAPAATPK